ncbi:MAG: hypothetical protein QM736_04470 [Vicinamibacterales bacterium]
MRVAVFNPAFERSIVLPDDLLDRFHALTGWAEALHAHGAGVTVVQAFGSSTRRSRHGVDYVFCRARSQARWLDAAMCDAVIASSPDVVHVNGLDAALQAWALRRAVPEETAIVMQDHATQPGRPGFIRRWLRRRIMAASDGFLFSTRDQAQPWLDAGLIERAEQVHAVLAGSSNVEPLPYDDARRLTGTQGRPAVLWVGRLTANKDPLCVLGGFEQAKAMLPDATLTMVFDTGPLRAAVADRVAASAVLSRCVRLVGPVPHEQIGRWFSAARSLRARKPSRGVRLRGD